MYWGADVSLKKANTFEAALLAGLILAGIAAAVNLRFYLVYRETVVKCEPLVLLSDDTVNRALDRMNLTNEQRDLFQRTIGGDQKSIVSLHEALLGTLRALQRQYGRSTVEWAGSVLFFSGLLLLSRRRHKP
jgi:hypothetical protein